MKLLRLFVFIGALATLSGQAALPLRQPVDRGPSPQKVRLDTLYVIPAGPVAGGFTPKSRVQVIDTIAGWARIQVEGWTPVPTLTQRQSLATSALAEFAAPGSEQQATQCTAITKKGTRCKRAARPGSTRCWQHP